MKRLLSAILLITLLVCAAAISVQATEATCPHCGEAMDAINWTSWSFTDGEIAGGHYYLTREYYGQTAMIKIPEGADVCLDLQDKMYFANDIHPFDIYGTLTIMDSQGNGQFVTTGKNGNSGGFAKIKSTGTLNIMGGTIRRTEAEGVTIYTGGLVYIEGGIMNVSGGALVGGIARANTSYSAQGGNIYMKGGTLNISGGTITGGMALSTTGKPAQGGNIYAGPKDGVDAVVRMTGGVVSDGYSDQNGGNIYLYSADLDASKGAQILGGHAIQHAGNIAIMNGNTNVTLTNATVAGGVAGGKLNDAGQGSGGGGNIFGYEGTLNITDSTIDGDIRLESGITSASLSGTVKIGLGRSNGLFLHKNTDLDVSGLKEDSEIFVCASDVFTLAIPEADAQKITNCFKGAIRTLVELNSDFTFKGTAGNTGYCPHCGELVTWTAGLSTTKDGHFYMTGNVIAAENSTVTANAVLDLNGYTLERTNRRMIFNTAGKSLAVLDSVGGGKMQGTGTVETYNKYGGLIDFVAKASFTLYSGTVRMNPGDGTSVVPYGGTIYSRASGSQVSINGGIISGGVLKASGATGGGNIYMIKGDTLTVNAGMIKGGNAGVAKGGNIYNAGTTNITGGFIVTGTAADGGNLYTTGKTTISGGTVYGGSVTDDAATTDTTEGRGGNIHATSTLEISGGTVNSGKARIGGNIYSSSALSISNAGMICAGVASTNGGNAYITGTLNMTGGTVTAGSAKLGGNFYFYADGKTAAFSGGLVTAGIAQAADDTGKGGNIYISKGTVTLSDQAVISRGIADYGGGNVYINGSTMNLTGGQILGGRTSASTKDGGSVYIAASAHLNMSGGELSGGYASDCGGNIYMSSANSKLTISGGTITGGYAYKYGGNVCLNNGIMNMTGGTVSYGRGGRGGNFCLMFYASSTATIGGENNPKIIGGTAIAGEGGNILFMDQAHQPNSSYAPHATAPWLAIGKCTISDGKAASFGKNIYINKYAYLRILDSFDGETSAYFHDYLLPTDKLYGGVLAEGLTASGDFTGKLLMENMDSAPFLVNKGGSLAIADAAYVKDGVFSWFVDNAAMMAAYDPDADYILAGSGELVLGGGTYTVDLAGKTVNITGSGAVYGLDSANDTYETYGSATFGENITLAGFKAQQGHKIYFALNDGNTYSFHRMGMDITSVSLRPKNAGLYYTAQWRCDDVLAQQVEAHGVAMSLKGAPGNDFKIHGGSLSTTQPGLRSGTTGNGVLLTDILKTSRPDKNSAYAQMPVHAAAYVTIGGKNYTGPAVAYSLHGMLKTLSKNAYDYYTNVEVLQGFMDTWDDYGLTGSDWQLSYEVPEAIVNLQTLYAGTKAYQGELHDHADTGGTSDGHNTLTEWLDGMQKLDMDFATIVDHKQYLHMELPEWDNKYFIGGTELAVGVSDLASATQNKAHINIIFYDPMDLKAAIEEYDAYDSKGGFKAQVYADDYSGTDADKLAGGWHFEYLFGATAPTKADMAKLVEIVRKHNGVFVQVHPKSSSYIKSDDPLDYWFADQTGLEVFYTIYSDRNSTATKNNYKLWTSLLKLGKKIWATAGNDEHAAPANKALSTIYSTEQDAKAFVERLGVGNFTAGHVGVQMVVGDQVMGGETDFTGKALAFRVGDFHSSVYDPTHTYQAVLIADEEVIGRWDISCEETFYHTTEADASVGYYRVEIYDLTTNEMLALGNPIWNTAK